MGMESLWPCAVSDTDYNKCAGNLKRQEDFIMKIWFQNLRDCRPIKCKVEPFVNILIRIPG